MRRNQAETGGGVQELRAEFERRGLNPAELWEPEPNQPELGAGVLGEILRWVEAYTACPDRTALERRGLLYPPVNPDCDPDSDWLRFERWMRKQPLSWNYAREFGPLQEAAALTDEALEAEFARIEERLEERGVVVDISEEVPLRARYEYLRAELANTVFEFTAPGTQTHLTGCGGDCEECFQRPWCETACELAALDG